MENSQKVKDLLDGARVAHRNRDFQAEAEKFFAAAKVVESEKNYEKAARLFVRAAKRFKRTNDPSQGQQAGEMAAKNYAAAGRPNTTMMVYEATVRTLSEEGYNERAEIVRRKMNRFKKKYHIDKQKKISKMR
ncbi:MAG: hypothetical protein ABH950_07345 [Candidatus Altiarchaeota archaeon]